MIGDRYAGEWPRERFQAHGIAYRPAERPRSDLYRDLLPLLNSNQVELLDLPRLRAQLCSLERRTSRGGRDSIDHPAGSHDDLANSVAGVLTYVIGRGKSDPIFEIYREQYEKKYGSLKPGAPAPHLAAAGGSDGLTARAAR